MENMLLLITIKPSKYIIITVIVLHGIAIAAMWLAAIFISIKLLCSLFLLLSSGYYSLYRSPQAVTQLSYYSTGWVLQTRQKKFYTVTLRQPYFVTSIGIILRFRCEKPIGLTKNKTVILTAETVEAEAWRQLTRRLYENWSEKSP